MKIPDKNCPFCPRLAEFREQNKITFPTYHNAPVPSFGELNAELLVVGLAPGLHGANATGRPFTGDYAGTILYSALKKHGFAKGEYEAQADDGFKLINCRITNAVRCVPPQNKPETSEIAICNRFLIEEVKAMDELKVILTLGQISHNAVLKVFGGKPKDGKFGHGAVHKLGGVQIFNSYHTSRYNINTRVLTEAMFDEVMANIRKKLTKP